ncbi:hypothetical protein, partial [Gordonibacter pamelaeae]|uniref:hypothetical protein n=1 Tax=Gordonibacter pamelaeae TaxID=471189 RepID=UPI001E56FE3A
MAEIMFCFELPWYLRVERRERIMAKEDLPLCWRVPLSFDKSAVRSGGALAQQGGELLEGALRQAVLHAAGLPR